MEDLGGGGGCGGGERERGRERERVAWSASFLSSSPGHSGLESAQDGADGVNGADLGALHHRVPGDSSRQRLRIQRDHRQPGEDPPSSRIR